MKKALAAVALSAMALGSATSASATVATLCSSGPTINLVDDGCLAPGNDNLFNVETALASALGVDINSLMLSLYGKSDTNPNPGLFDFSEPLNATFGFDVDTVDWTVLDGTLIKYVTVKAGSDFLLFELDGDGASSGTATSDGIEVGGGNTPAISHISFWTVPGAPIPEPATWAMMIMGLGFAGSMMRRRTTKVQFA